ncbi:MAG: hydroxymethylglutaryl-CoA synthase family protein [Promethearchaeati archaeon]
MSESNNDFFFNVGIDSMGFYTTKHYVDLTELAEIRGVDPNKYLIGLLTKQMRIPGPGEDIVSMAVKASQHALMKGNIDPNEIDAVFLGTETMTYAVKSVSNILSEILDSSVNCVTQDVYNACAGATLAVLNAVGLINDGIINKAMVIGADICSYELESPGEPTQGAAAAALVISKNPRIAAFGKKFGKLSANVFDFYRLPKEEYPVVFGKFSIDSYVRFQMGALDDFYQYAGNIIPDYLVFHSPFAKLPLKNIENLLLNRWTLMKKILLNKSVDTESPVKIQEEASINLEKLVNNVLDDIKREENLSNTEDLKNDLIKSLTNKVLPALNVPMSIGNMYSASVWGQLIYMLESVVEENDLIYFGSYGSGATCISGLLKVMPEFKKIVEQTPKVENYIEKKKQISIEEYERLRKESDTRKYAYAEIEPHPSNKNFFIKMNICEGGCLISKLDGVDFCPDGKNDTYVLRLPMYAVVKSDPVDTIDEKDLLNETIVRVTPKTKKGQIVEYTLLRAGKNESLVCVQSGYINWIPTYKPVPYPLI